MAENKKEVSQQSAPIDFEAVWTAIKKYKRLYYKTLGIAFVIALIIGFSLPKTYSCQILLAPETRDIVNFLIRPIISLKKDEENELSLFYHKYNETDFENFYKEVIQLTNKPIKQREEIRLISICNKRLKQINI